MSKHEWRENTEDGDVRFVRMERHARQWTLKTRLKSEAEAGWIRHETIPLDDLEYLRELLWNKYQRRRVPVEQIAEIDALIEEARYG